MRRDDPRRDLASLLDAVEAARAALSFTAGMDRGAFIADLKTQSAVQHQLLVLGEAVKRISSSYRQQHPQLPWRDIAGTRDNLIHGYDQVDLEEVWDIVTRDLPAFLAQAEPLLPAEEA